MSHIWSYAFYLQPVLSERRPMFAGSHLKRAYRNWLTWRDLDSLWRQVRVCEGFSRWDSFRMNVWAASCGGLNSRVTKWRKQTWLSANIITHCFPTPGSHNVTGCLILWLPCLPFRDGLPCRAVSQVRPFLSVIRLVIYLVSTVRAVANNWMWSISGISALRRLRQEDLAFDTRVGSTEKAHHKGLHYQIKIEDGLGVFH